MITTRRFALLAILTLALTACAAFGPSERGRKASLDDFMYALRWQQYPTAAAHFAKEHRRAFLDRMEQVRELNVTDVRLVRIDLREEGRLAEVRLEMDYYILPSATLKTLRIDQTWRYFETADAEQNGFLITTPFPPFP